METLKSIDQSLFFFFNGLHWSWLDPVMYYGSLPLVWIPLFLGLFFLVIRRFGWQTIWVLLFTVLLVMISDQLSNVFKELVARPRPTFEPGLTGIHTVYGYMGGQYGFYSAHASTNLALAVFLIIVLGRPFRYFPFLILLWAVFMAYTRIYLGVHYPGDILAGWLAGGIIGFGTGWLCRWYLDKSVKLQAN